MAQLNTHSIWFHVGATRWGWDLESLDACQEKLRSVMKFGMQRWTKGGTLLITPWHSVTKVEIKPIRRRGAGK